MSLGERISDAVTAFAGRWTFIWAHLVWWSVWIPTGLFGHDRFPFGLLTMVLSLEAILLSCLVLMAANRQAERDAVRDNRAASEVDEIDQIDHEAIELLREMRQHVADHAEELKLLRALFEERGHGQEKD